MKLMRMNYQIHVTLMSLKRSLSQRSGQSPIESCELHSILNHCKDLNQKLHKIFLQSSHDMVSFSSSRVERSKSQKTFP